MNQTPPRTRTIRNAPPPLIRPRTQRRNLNASAQLPIQRRNIIHPPILGARAFIGNNNNATTIGFPNANRLANFNSNSNINSNNNMRMPATKRRKIMNNKKNKNTKKARRISIHNVPN